MFGGIYFNAGSNQRATRQDAVPPARATPAGCLVPFFPRCRAPFCRRIWLLVCQTPRPSHQLTGCRVPTVHVGACACACACASPLPPSFVPRGIASPRVHLLQQTPGASMYVRIYLPACNACRLSATARMAPSHHRGRPGQRHLDHINTPPPGDRGLVRRPSTHRRLGAPSGLVFPAPCTVARRTRRLVSTRQVDSCSSIKSTAVCVTGCQMKRQLGPWT